MHGPQRSAAVFPRADAPESGAPDPGRWRGAPPDGYTLSMPFRTSEGPNPSRSAARERRPRQTAVPSVLDLVRLSPEPVFPPGGEALYQQIVRITELERDHDVLDAACGRGLTTEYLAANHGVHCTGIDPDETLIHDAEERMRAAGLGELVNFQAAAPDDLPFTDDAFDVTIGELGLTAEHDPAASVAELARVTKPMGSVVLVQLVWNVNIDESRREELIDHLGARPLLLVEWKQHLRDAGCVDLYVEDWSDAPSPFRQGIRGPFHDFAEIFTFRQKLAILRRAVRRWGWRGVRGAIVREQEIHRLLTRERVLGLTLVIGRKWRVSEEESAA